MGLYVTIEWENYEKLAQELKEREDMTPFKTVVKANGARLQKETMKITPIDTGALMRSISLKITEGGLTALVAPGMHYAAYVEFGTRFMAAQPYVRPAFDTVRAKFISDLRKLID